MNDLIDAIFGKLSAIYGRDFLGRYEGQKLDIVKAEWARQLAGFDNQPEAIAHALDNLPSDKPPTVLQFRDLARKAPEKTVLALPAPINPALADRVRAEIARLRKGGRPDPKDWARRILDRAQQGASITPYSLRSAEIALGLARSHA